MSEVSLDPQSAVQLIADQFPELAGRTVLHLEMKGTDNHIFRIGDDLCARFPKVGWAVGTAAREAAALPRFAGAPVPVPEVYGLGEPCKDYPYAWSILTWLSGSPLEDSGDRDPIETARRLSDFFCFLKDVPADQAFRYGEANNGRGASLESRSARFRSALKRLPNVDRDWAGKLWSRALAAGAPKAPVWLHGDVHPGNVLFKEGRLCGVIDWGLSGVGDGACDLLTAWAMFDREPREVFRKALGATDAEWLRGAGWALSMAVIYLPYAYENGLRTDMSEKMIDRLMEEFT